MKENYRWISEKDLILFAKMHRKKTKDWFNNQFHLSSFSGVVNDPNGLVYFQGQYYIFMQNCPFSAEHQTKSWLLYTTKDWINYVYQGITITPSTIFDQQGVFSGSALIENNQLVFYYTGNVKNNQENRTSYTMKATINLEKKVVEKSVLFSTNLQFYSGHFRDPIVFNRGQEQKTFLMLNGAQTVEKKGVLVLSQSSDYHKWGFVKNLSFDQLLSESYMLECPGYLQNGKDEYLWFCAEQNKPLIDDGHSVWLLKGFFNQNWDFLITGKLQKLDYGLDFYAPQIFQNTKPILLGWLGNSKAQQQVTNANGWNGQLTIPRLIKFQEGKIYQVPLLELQKLRLKVINFSDDLKYDNGLVELEVDKIKQTNFSLVIKNDKDEYLEIIYLNQILKINRQKMSFNDAVNLPPEFKIPISQITHLQMLIDRSCLEIFLNHGEFTISINFFVKNHHQIITNLKNVQAYQLKPILIEWKNCLFTNKMKTKKRNLLNKKSSN